MFRAVRTGRRLARAAGVAALGLGLAVGLAAWGRSDASAATPLPELETGGPDGVTAPIDVNAAGEEQLMLLPGIGPAKAKAILTYRMKRPFRVVNDLLRVKGIGPALLKRIRPFVTVTSDTLSPPAKDAARVRRE